MKSAGRLGQVTTRLVANLALATCLLTACGAPQSPSPTSPTPTPDLAELRVQFDVPDCVATDLAVEAIADGLPQTNLQCLGSDRRVNLAGLPRVPTIINVWAQWCGPCREEASYLRDAAASLDDVSFLGINYNDPLPDWALEFAGLANWGYPHVMDQDKLLQTELGIPGIPTTFFVAADGRVVGVHPGVLDSEQQLLDLAAEYLGVSP